MKNYCYSKLATRPILYTDTIKGEQTLRDDLWAVTTEELNQQIASTIQQCVLVLEGMRKDNLIRRSPDGSATNQVFGYNQALDEAITKIKELGEK